MRKGGGVFAALIFFAVVLLPVPAGAELFNLGPGEGLGGDDPLPFGHSQDRVFRTIDGYGNNIDHPQRGAVGIQLLRLTGAYYGNGYSEPAGADRPSTRVVSNIGCAQTDSVPNAAGASDLFWQWGQFLDHDIDLNGHTGEYLPIPVPEDDPYFAPGTEIPLFRSAYDPATGTDNPRQQINNITAFIDASNVYGSDPVRAAALRTYDGTGRLKMSPGGLLPFNTEGLDNDGGPDPTLFLAGDLRANEQVGLTAVPTLFVREHNRLARWIKATHPFLSGEEVYQRARSIVGAEMQVITYKEFLPLLLGPYALEPYVGYQPEVDPGISNIFSTAAYRFGHSMLSPTLLRLNAFAKPIPEGHLALGEAFFAPQELVNTGIEPLLRGLASQVAQEVDALVVDGVRNTLFRQPFDLVALNMQRGRDHGLPGYNQARVDLGLDPVSSFADISSDPVVQDKLETIFGDVDKIDVWVGGLAEDHVFDAMVGELFFHVLKGQFERLRDGDRFWYQNVYRGVELQMLENTTLADIIRLNTRIGYEIQDKVLVYQPKNSWHMWDLGLWGE